MGAPEKVIRYQKHNVDFRIFADTTEFIESCDKGFEGMDDVMRTEYVRADLLAAKDAELVNARETLMQIRDGRAGYDPSIASVTYPEFLENLAKFELERMARAAVKGVE